MKRLLIVLLTTLAVLASAMVPILTGCSEPEAPTPAEPTPSEPTPPSEEPIVLKSLLTTTGQTPGGWTWKSIENEGWAKAVEEATNGRVTTEYLVGAVTDPGKFDSLVAGAGDIAYGVCLINSGRWPTLEIMTVPDLFTVCHRPSKVAWDLWKAFPVIEEEFSEVKLLATYATTPSPPGIGFATTDKKITTLEDMEGVKMGIYGEVATKTVAALGFTTVAIPPFEVYESMQRGVVDGSFMDVNFMTDQNVGEIAKYWVSCSLMFCPFYFAMNWDTWNSLPPDIQKIMEDLAYDIPDAADTAITIDKAEALKAYPDVEFLTIDEEEKLRWRERQDPIQDEYLSGLSADGHEIHKEMLRLMDVYRDPLPLP